MPTPVLVEQHLARLAEELELPTPLHKEKSGAFRLGLGRGMTITLKVLEEGFHLFTEIAPLPAQKREELLILLMRANFLGQGTGGSAIGLDKDEKFLTLSFAIPYEVDYKAFKEMVEDFTNFAHYWRTEVSKHASDAEKTHIQ
ncbi:MAG: type III secretion system chaperone [Chlamydiales bacterium]